MLTLREVGIFEVKSNSIINNFVGYDHESNIKENETDKITLPKVSDNNYRYGS